MQLNTAGPWARSDKGKTDLFTEDPAEVFNL